MSIFATDDLRVQPLALTARDQFFGLVSKAGGYGLPVSLGLAALISKNPDMKLPIVATIVALSAGQAAYFLRLFPWPESISQRPLESNLASIDTNLETDDPNLLNKLHQTRSNNPATQRTLDTTLMFVRNHDFKGFPSVDLAALTAGLISFDLQNQSPFFNLFTFAIVLSCAYTRVNFVPFHTWPQVLSGIATGVGYAFFAKQFGAIPSGIATNFATLAFYTMFAQKMPKPVVQNLGYFLCTLLFFLGLNPSA